MLEKRLVPLRAGGGTPALSKEEKELLIKREQYWKTACEKRAKIKKDLWSLVRDALPEEMKAEDIAVSCSFKWQEVEHFPRKLILNALPRSDWE